MLWCSAWDISLLHYNIVLQWRRSQWAFEKKKKAIRVRNYEDSQRYRLWLHLNRPQGVPASRLKTGQYLYEWPESQNCWLWVREKKSFRQLEVEIQCRESSLYVSISFKEKHLFFEKWYLVYWYHDLRASAWWNPLGMQNWEVANRQNDQNPRQVSRIFKSFRRNEAIH